MKRHDFHRHGPERSMIRRRFRLLRIRSGSSFARVYRMRPAEPWSARNGHLRLGLPSESDLVER